jgi:hypothetical protein
MRARFCGSLLRWWCKKQGADWGETTRIPTTRNASAVPPPEMLSTRETLSFCKTLRDKSHYFKWMQISPGVHSKS